MGEWQLVPKEPTREMLDAMPTLPAIQLPVPDVERGLMPSQVQNRTRYLAALAAAPKIEVQTIRDELQAVIDYAMPPSAKAEVRRLNEADAAHGLPAAAREYFPRA